MKEIFIHIGMYKAGSTFFQKSILEKINHDSFEIITPYRNNNYFKLFREILRNNCKKSYNLLKQNLNKIGKKKIIISSEAFFGHQADLFKTVEKRFKILEDIFQSFPWFISHLLSN